MKKIIALIALVAVGVVGFKGWQYYQETYQGVTAYALVPDTVPEKVQTVDDSGNKIDGWSSYDYQLTFVKTDGSTQQLEYELSNSDPTPLRPGAIVKAKISQKRVIEGPNEVPQDKVPAEVLKKLQ